MFLTDCVNPSNGLVQLPVLSTFGSYGLSSRFNTKRLILKPLSLDDIPSYETHFIDYEVIRHLSAVVPWPYPRNGVSEILSKRASSSAGNQSMELGVIFERAANRSHRLLRALAPRHPREPGILARPKVLGSRIDD